MRATGIALAVLLLATGCSGGDAPAAAPTVTSTSPSPSTATVQQFASVVARITPELVEKFDEHGVTADARIDRLEVMAGLAHDLWEETKALGAPPAEVRTLLEETQTAAGTAHNAYADLVTCLNENEGSTDACADEESAAGVAVERLLPVLRGWKPYGG